MGATATTGYIGRFAPSPTGPLHDGSLVAALASWLDARAHGGQWLVRIEDVDTTRCLPGMDRRILQQLSQCGLHADAPPVWQSQRSGLYQQALAQLLAQGLAYPCSCSRKAIEAALRDLGLARARRAELRYPGTCRASPASPPHVGQTPPAVARAWRLRTDISWANRPEDTVDRAQTAINSIADHVLPWIDRRLGAQQQDVAAEVGDFVLKRADGCYSYQLAVVVDDAAQGVTDVLRGGDLLDNTARQILLQRALGLPTPRYLHTPLVLGVNREKLSKQNGAQAIDTLNPLAALNRAATVLGLHASDDSVAGALQAWVKAWAQACR